MIAVPAMALASGFFSKSMEPLLDEAILSPGKNAMQAILFFILMGLLDLISSFVHKIYREKLRTSFLSGIKKDVMEGIMKMDFKEFHKESSSYYIAMLQRDIKKMSADYFDSICGIYRVVTCFLITMILLIQMNPWICVINLVISFFSVFLPELMGKKIEGTSKKASEDAAEYQGVVSDALLGFRTIKLFSITGKVNALIEKKNIQLEKSEYESVKMNYMVSYISIVMSQIGFILTMAIGAYCVIQGKMTVGAVIAISQLIGGILVPFEELPVFLTNLKSIKNVKEKIEHVIAFHNTEQVAFSDYTIDYDMISFENIHFCYDEKPILQNISFDFEKNKKYILVGESGSGKSTIAKLIVKMVTQESGSIKIGNHDLNQISDEILYRNVNYMQQDVFLFEDTLLHNITLYRNYPESEVNRVIDCVGLREYVDDLENGLDTLIMDNGYNLSGGQKQRIGIARSLLSGAKVLIFDEITSNLDVILEKKIEEMIFQLEDVTVIMITHSLNKETLRKADHILVLKNGILSETGTYEDLMEKKGYFYGYTLVSE